MTFPSADAGKAGGAGEGDESATLPLVVLPHASPDVSRAQARPLPGVFAVLDLADKDCGDGPLDEVAVALRTVPAGSGLEVRTTNGNVAVALLVWCRLVGLGVIEQSLGQYLVFPASPHAS